MITQTKINFLGDLMFGELIENFKVGVKTQIEKYGLDPFLFCRDELLSSDLNIGNLECVITNKSNKQFPFNQILRAPEQFVKILKDNRINIVNTANNHALDHGLDAFNDSMRNLQRHGIDIIGYNINNFFQLKPHIITNNDLSFGFLAYNLSNINVIKLFSQVKLITDVITKSKKEVDFLILSLHWGFEYTDIPSPLYIEFAKKFWHAGCDVIHGHHSHRLQGVICKDNKVFAPSLGNFIFDDTRKANRHTGILCVNINKTKRIKCDFSSYYINKRFQPEKCSSNKYFKKVNKKLSKIFSLKKHEKIMKLDEIIRRKVKYEHTKNRIRMRAKMIKHFYHYLSSVKPIFFLKIIKKDKMFSVIKFT